MVLKNIKFNWKPFAAIIIAVAATAAKTKLPDEVVDSVTAQILDYLQIGSLGSVLFMDGLVKAK